MDANDPGIENYIQILKDAYFVVKDITDEDLELCLRKLEEDGRIFRNQPTVGSSSPKPKKFDKNSKQQWDKSNIFGSISIKYRTPEAAQMVTLIKMKLEEGSLTPNGVENILNIMIQNNEIKVHKNNGNVFQNKGKSYADHVDGPNGWGKRVPVENLDPDLDGF